jgi:hypothetical protein
MSCSCKKPNVRAVAKARIFFGAKQRDLIGPDSSQQAREAFFEKRGRWEAMVPNAPRGIA